MFQLQIENGTTKLGGIKKNILKIILDDHYPKVSD